MLDEMDEIRLWELGEKYRQGVIHDDELAEAHLLLDELEAAEEEEAEQEYLEDSWQELLDHASMGDPEAQDTVDFFEEEADELEHEEGLADADERYGDDFFDGEFSELERLSGRRIDDDTREPLVRQAVEVLPRDANGAPDVARAFHRFYRDLPGGAMPRARDDELNRTGLPDPYAPYGGTKRHELAAALTEERERENEFQQENEGSAGRGPSWVAVGDFNADSRPDLAVANLDSNDVSVLLNSRATCASRAATIVGTAGADRLAGTRGPDVMVGGAGSDRLLGDGGRDLICAGTGNDRVAGGTGNDRLFGEGGSDRLSGGPGNDRLFGGPGNDRIKPGSGRDRVAAGGGDDRVLARDSRRDVIDCGRGRDVGIVDRVDRTRRCELVRRG